MDYETLLAWFSQQHAHASLEQDAVESEIGLAPLFAAPASDGDSDDKVEQLPNGIAGTSILPAGQLVPTPWQERKKPGAADGHRESEASEPQRQQQRQDSSSCSSSSQHRLSSAGGSAGTFGSAEPGAASSSPEMLQMLQSNDPIARGLVMLQNPALAPDGFTRQMVQEASVRFFNMRKATPEQKMAFVQDLVVRVELKKARMQRQASASELQELLPES
eukprot:6390875-Amphidinium_carterae.1